MHKKLIVIAFVLLLLSGCKKNTELIEPYTMTNQNIETMKSKNEQGIYEISGSKEQLIIYRGIDKGIKTMTYTINNNKLTIIFETEEIEQPKDFAYKLKSTSSFDYLLITIDGKEVSFNTIFG